MKHPALKVLFNLLASCAVCTVLVSSARAQQPGANIALGKPATFSAPPNYALCTDPDDNIQLTDGKFMSDAIKNNEDPNSIWTQKGTVGWQYISPVTISFDLGQEQPISGALFSTAGGRAGVTWPSQISMAVSNDNKTWHRVGDLVELSRKNGAPPADGPGTFRYTTHDLKTHGRYMAFTVVNAPFIFVDEIEIYAGDPSFLKEPLSTPVFQNLGDMTAYLSLNENVRSAGRRISYDAAAVRASVQAADIPAARKSTLLDQLHAQELKIDDLTTLPADFETIVPFNDTHRAILAVYGELLAAQGAKPLTVWKQHRYAWLPLLAKPDADAPPQLGFAMLKNQFRSDALLMTNAAATAKTVTLKLAGGPQNGQPGWLEVNSVAWTDTYGSGVVPDALVPVAAENGVYSVTVPAGMTRKVWFIVNSSKVAPGRSRSTLQVADGSTHLQVPVTFDVASVAMKTPRLSLGMWDYTNGNGYGGVTPQNRAAAIALMRSHYVDSPWATREVLPLPAANVFDADGNLQGKLDFTSFDQWINFWPQARHYFVFANVNDELAGAPMNTLAFNARVGSWAKALSAHMTELGLKPGQLGLLLVDEPRNPDHDATMAAWVKPIKAAAPELTLFTDPVWERPDQTKNQEAITLNDILSPQLPIYYRGGAPVKNYFENLRREGKQLWFYQCTGPVRSYDPQAYYRDQAWHTFSIGGVGQGFWAFGDTGKAPSSWQEYLAAGVPMAPAFLGKDSANNSVHWEAVREGMEDYEALAMLQDAIKSSANAAWKAKAQETLDHAVSTVTASWTGDYKWQSARNLALADQQLQKVQQMLTQAS